MSRKGPSSASGRIAILLALLAPGAGLFFWGIARCASSATVTPAAGASCISGLCLVLAGGLYHYWTDYRQAGPRPVASFLATCALSAMVALLASRLLFR